MFVISEQIFEYSNTLEYLNTLEYSHICLKKNTTKNMMHRQRDRQTNLTQKLTD